MTGGRPEATPSLGKALLYCALPYLRTLVQRALDPGRQSSRPFGPPTSPQSEALNIDTGENAPGRLRTRAASIEARAGTDELAGAAAPPRVIRGPGSQCNLAPRSSARSSRRTTHPSHSTEIEIEPSNHRQPTDHPRSRRRELVSRLARARSRSRAGRALAIG
jgi:hypothetical protein